MTKEEKDFEKVQGEALELIKNKKGNKKMKAPKEVKTYTLKQIIKTVIVTVALLAIGAFAGITINNAINSQIKSEVTSQVKAFTQAE